MRWEALAHHLQDGIRLKRGWPEKCRSSGKSGHHSMLVGVWRASQTESKLHKIIFDHFIDSSATGR